MGFPEGVALPLFFITIGAVIYCVLKPPTISIPRTPLKFKLKYQWVPCIGVVSMLICTSISFDDVGRGLKGDSHLQPWGTLALWVSCMTYFSAQLHLNKAVLMSGVAATQGLPVMPL